MSLWALLAAPLLAGNDLRAMTPDIAAILTNPDVIAVDQDRLGRQGRRVRKDGDLEIWSKALDGGAYAVGLFNRGESPAEVSAACAELGACGYRVRDLWLRRDLGCAGRAARRRRARPWRSFVPLEPRALTGNAGAGRRFVRRTGIEVISSIYGVLSVAVAQRASGGLAADPVVNLGDRRAQARLSRPATTAFFKLAQAWGLKDDAARQLLGGISNGAYYQLKRGDRKTLDQDKLTRISLLIGIFSALNVLYSRKLADAWMNRPNAAPMFQGDTPLAYLLRGGLPAFVRVRQLLDARRGGR